MMEVNCPVNLQASEGLGADNMTCIIIQFRDEADVAKDHESSTAAESAYEKEEYKK